jgi:hypothetical protein
LLDMLSLVFTKGLWVLQYGTGTSTWPLFTIGMPSEV